MTAPDIPTVFIVYDDARMRAAMQRLLKTVGLHSESFATPQDFLRRNLPVSDRVAGPVAWVPAIHSFFTRIAERCGTYSLAADALLGRCLDQ